MCKSIHHLRGDRASCRVRIALGENHRGSGVTFKVRVTWGAVIDSVCTASSTPVDKSGQGSKLSATLDFKSGYPPVEFRGKSWTTCSLLGFQRKVLPKRAALQPCLEGPVLRSGQARLLAPNLERSVVAAAVLAPYRASGSEPRSCLWLGRTLRRAGCRWRLSGCTHSTKPSLGAAARCSRLGCRRSAPHPCRRAPVPLR